MEKREWTVPASRMKTRVEHKVPLSQPSLDLLRDPPRDNHDFVFLSSRPGKPLSQESMLRVMRRMGRKEAVHGFRAAFSTWAHETKGADIAPGHVIEMSLAHKVGTEITEACRHTDLLDKRRVLLDAWCRHCTETGEVVQLRAAQ
jgi:integrase